MLYFFYLFIFCVVTWIFRDMARIGVARHALTARLRALVCAGIPLDSGLRCQVETPGKTGRLMEKLSDRLTRGMTLAEALDGVWVGLPHWYVAMIREGERNGQLAETLALANEADVLAEKSRLSTCAVFVYPLALLVAAGVPMFAMRIILIPRLESMFWGLFDIPMMDWPATLVALAFWGDLLTLVVGACILACLPFPPWWGRLRLTTLERFTPLRWLGVMLAHLRSRLPWIGKVCLRGMQCRWLALTGALLHSGLPLHEAMRRAAEAEVDPLFRNAARQWSTRAAAGETLAAILAEASRFPAVTRAALMQAEGTERLPDVLCASARELATAERMRISRAAQVLAVGLLLLVGAQVGFICVTIFYPIVEMSLMM